MRLGLRQMAETIYTLISHNILTFPVLKAHLTSLEQNLLYTCDTLNKMITR